MECLMHSSLCTWRTGKMAKENPVMESIQAAAEHHYLLTYCKVTGNLDKAKKEFVLFSWVWQPTLH